MWEEGIYSKYFPTHESSEIGSRLFGDPSSDLPGLGMATHLSIFPSGGYAPCLRRLVKRSTMVLLFPAVATSIIPDAMLSGPVAEAFLVAQSVLAMVS